MGYTLDGNMRLLQHAGGGYYKIDGDYRVSSQLLTILRPETAESRHGDHIIGNDPQESLPLQLQAVDKPLQGFLSE